LKYRDSISPIMIEEKIYAEIGLNVLKQRRLQNLTQEDVANSIDMSRSRLSLIERGKIDFRFSTLIRIACALKIDYRILLEVASLEKKI